jgi:hypothetical protein
MMKTANPAASDEAATVFKIKKTGKHATECKGEQGQEIGPANSGSILQAVGEGGKIIQQADHRHNKGDLHLHAQQSRAESGNVADEIGRKNSSRAIKRGFKG